MRKKESKEQILNKEAIESSIGAVCVVVAMEENGQPVAIKTFGWPWDSRYVKGALRVCCGVGGVVQE